jgi:hypothetical protein
MKPIPKSFVSRYGARLMRVYRWIWLGRIEPRSPEIPRGSLVLAAPYHGLVDAFVDSSQLDFPPRRKAALAIAGRRNSTSPWAREHTWSFRSMFRTRARERGAGRV